MSDEFAMTVIIQTIKDKYSSKIADVFKNYITEEVVDIENLEVDLEDLSDSFLISHMVDRFHWGHDEVNRFFLLIRKCLDPNIAELTRMPTCLAKANMPSEYLVRGYLRRIEQEWRLCRYNQLSTLHRLKGSISSSTDIFDDNDHKNLDSMLENNNNSILDVHVRDLQAVNSKDSSDFKAIKDDIIPIEVHQTQAKEPLMRRLSSNFLSQSETNIAKTPLFNDNNNSATLNSPRNPKMAINSCMRHSISSFERTMDSDTPIMSLGMDAPIFELARSLSMMTIPEEITKLCVKYLQEICVYAVGRNDRGEFGIPGRRNFTKLTELEWITKEVNFTLFTIIPCTLNGIAYISETRNLYVCGFNKWAQFGLGHCEHAVEVPTLHTFYQKRGMKISYISHGQRAYHMFVMLTDGSIYAHGANEWGQLGLNRQLNKEMHPVLLPVSTWISDPKSSITQITCGIEHSIFLTNTGDVYSCGRNKWGQLGFGPPVTEILVPRIIQTFGDLKINTIECGDSNTYVIDENKNIWSWGRNEFGELGCDDQEIVSRWEPMMIMFFIENDIPINKLVVGSDHVLVLDEYGKVYSWGFGRFGCCGDGTRRHHYKPIEITALSRFRITDVSCGSTHSIAITDDREIFSWGYNLMNQCCIDTFNETRIITCREIRSPRMVTTAINKLFSPQPNVLGIRTATNSTLFIIENFAFQNYNKNINHGICDDSNESNIDGIESGRGIINTEHSVD